MVLILRSSNQTNFEARNATISIKETFYGHLDMTLDDSTHASALSL